MVISPHNARLRRPLLIASAVILLAAVLLMVVRCAGEETAAAGEPRSYDMTSLWDNKDVGLPLGYQAETGTILLWENRDVNKPLSPHRVAAYEVSTGKKKWANAPSGWDANADYIRGNKLTAQAIIVQSNYPRDAPAFAAMRLTDGKVLWTVPTPGKSSRPAAVTANVVVVAWDSKTLRGLGAGDGAKLWEASLPEGCETGQVGGDADLFVAMVVCEKKRYLESFDPATGKSRWQHAVPVQDEATAGHLSVQGGAAVLSDKELLVLVSASGAVLLEVETGGPGEVRFTATSELAVVAYSEKSGAQTLAVADLPQAKIRWSKPLAIGSLSLFGGKLYSLAPLPEPLVPVGLYEIDLVSGRMAVSLTHLKFSSYDSLVAISGDTAVTYYHANTEPTNTSHLHAHHLEPHQGPMGYAGGAPVGSWPDSCSLLLPAEVGESYKAQPAQVTVIDAVLPAASCVFQPSSVAFPVVTTAIAWSGTDVEQAKKMMELVRQHEDSVSVPAIGDEAVQVEIFGFPAPTTEVFFRAGSRIGKVSIVGDSALALKLAKVAVTRLG